MSFDPHSREFDPRRQFPAIETNGEETSEAPSASPFSSDEESSNCPAARDFDEALEQLASEKCCVCPLCGAIVASDGSVVSQGSSARSRHNSQSVRYSPFRSAGEMSGLA